MNKRIRFIKALVGACNGVHSHIISSEYYVVPMVRGLSDLCEQEIRESPSGNLDSCQISDSDWKIFKGFKSITPKGK